MSNVQEWQQLANKELSRREKTVDSLVQQTAEGIAIKPLYTEADLDNLEVTGTLPGLPPYVRGPRATMYTAQPWTIRQYAGFSTCSTRSRWVNIGVAAKILFEDIVLNGAGQFIGCNTLLFCGDDIKRQYW